MSLDDFAAQYELSQEIKEKLTAAKFSGPHTFRFIPQNDFITAVGLSSGQLAELLYVIELWKADM